MTLVKVKKHWSLYFGLLLWQISASFYFIWSYILTDPNLIFTSFSPYWSSQEWLWQNLLPNKLLLSWSYFVIISLLFVAWVFMLTGLKKKSFFLRGHYRQKKWLIILIYFLLISPFLFANNALSHDLFNYIFNAKMVIVYHANPHSKVALDFAADHWTRFMHNTHTPAPYWYGWTAISLLPFVLGLGKFTLTWLSFKLFSLASLIGLFFSLKALAQKLEIKVKTWHWATVFLNPFFLIEFLGNGHNDLWMMLFLVIALIWLVAAIKNQSCSLGRIRLRDSQLILGSALWFLLSISIKLATLIVLPWLLLLGLLAYLRINHVLWQTFAVWFKKKIDTLLKLTPLVFSIAFFLLLFSARSRQFLPWYLSWSFVWLPLLLPQAQKITFGLVRLDRHDTFSWLANTIFYWCLWLISFSFSSLFRYLPWLYYDRYTPQIILEQKAAIWLGGLLIFAWLILLQKSKLLLNWFVEPEK